MKYDIERIHADCVRWFESGVLEPWMKFALVEAKAIRVNDLSEYWLDYNAGHTALVFLGSEFDPGDTVTIMKCALLIGLDLEKYRLDLPVETRVRRRVYRVYRKFREK